MSEISQKERGYRAALYEVDGIGPARFKVLLKFFKSAENVWKAKESTLREIGLSESVVSEYTKKKGKIDPENHLKALAKLGIKVILVEDDSYPGLLKEVADHPQVLFVRGNFKSEDELSLAVVGTRKPTAYGREVTEKLVMELACNGFTIVSGLARGIDGIAHRSALEAGGRTIAVLGGGVDRVYPPEHVGLAKDISQHGAVISEFAPGKLPVPGNFPARNRVISGLSLGVLVIEGASKSGTKITASLAVEQNRQVFAVPGPITSRYSQAPADLLKLGAKPVTEVGDILEELAAGGMGKGGLKIVQKRREIDIEKLSGDERLIVELLEGGQLHINEIVKKSKKETASVSSLVTMMELKGILKHLGGMIYALA